MLDVIKVRGTHYEMGVSQGRSYRSIAGDLDFFKIMREMEVVQQAAPIRGPLFNFGIKALMKSGGRKMLKSIEKDLPKQYDYFCGIAEGLGVSPLTLATATFFENLSGDCRLDMKKGKGIPEIKPLFPPMGCSAGIIIKGSQGFLIKNFDFPNELEDYQIVRYHYPEDKKRYKSIGATVAVLPGVISGINEKGLALTVNAAYTHDFDLKQPPPSLYLQECLETMKTADDAKKYLSEVPFSAGWLITILDKSNKGYIVERSSSVAAVRELSPEKGGKVIVTANNYQKDETKKNQLPENAVWTIRGMKGEPVIFLSQWRKDRLEYLLRERIKKSGVLKVSDLRKILGDHESHPEVKWDESVCRHSKFYKTLSSVYMDTKSRKMSIHDGNPCSKNKTLEFGMDFKYDKPELRFLRKGSKDLSLFRKLI